MKISLRGIAVVDVSQVKSDQIEILKQGLVSKDACPDYFGSELLALGLTGGHVRLAFDSVTQSWYTRTEYFGDRPMSDDILKKVIDATVGQWADGIGSGCFSDVADSTGAIIDLWPIEERGQLQVDVDLDVTGPTVEHGMLKAAARDGDISRVRELLDQGVPIDEESEGSTPLYGATVSGQKNVAIELIKRGADIHARNTRDADPLMATALSNVLSDEDAYAIAQELLSRGACVNGRRGDYTPLFMALHRKKVLLAQLLREHGAED